MSGLGQQTGAFKSGLKKIKAFFLRQRWKEALIFLAFILLSFGFWMLQSLQEEFEMEVSIPIKIKNVPIDISLSDSIPDIIKVKLKDKGSVLMNYSFGRNFLPIEANFKTKAKEQSGTFTITSNEIESGIKKQLIATTSLTSFEPERIAVKYGKQAHKQVAVVFDGRIDLEQGIQLDGEVRINPAVVTVYATEEAIDSLPEIKTEYTRFKSVGKTLSKELRIKKIPGLSFDPEMITITIPVDEYSEKTLDVPVECIGIPNKYTVRLLPHTVKVSCNIPLSRFAELKENQFAIQIPFSELEQNLTGVSPIELTKKPAWVSVASLSPNKIEFVIEQNVSD